MDEIFKGTNQYSFTSMNNQQYIRMFSSLFADVYMSMFKGDSHRVRIIFYLSGNPLEIYKSALDKVIKYDHTLSKYNNYWAISFSHNPEAGLQRLINNIMFAEYHLGAKISNNMLAYGMAQYSSLADKYSDTYVKSNNMIFEAMGSLAKFNKGQLVKVKGIPYLEKTLVDINKSFNIIDIKHEWGLNGLPIYLLENGKKYIAAHITTTEPSPTEMPF